ncbi:5-demethoxyubiquinol-8 5-hydroxylase UbiM [Pseudomonas sp. ABC1]|uniref:5-demethoxyubiquinol-8 5-hydroxylase UbiM n=1 Tax=Pseudomonas sp. ABC1 TaxID=2748080 RepID=UPI0015C3DD89|nr:5-demethoxyubiquinol-8 5-hydroxylase UbiM [Pseudomonas sp. ABC1]QLF94424.1 5-demethoxyubiquinol-8 5-hydroxylase UbiM [Pseudomonas sp. ABC1]
MNVDIAIIGAGPAGLCLARALSGHGLDIVLIERQAEESLANPAFDGREIALSHASHHELQRLGLWQRFEQDDISILRDAQVHNGPSLFALRIEASQAGSERLGHLIPNQAIRRAAYTAASECPDVRILANSALTGLTRDERGVDLTLADGRRLRARLLVAADSRFSETRRMLGIGARMKDFGKSMLVCRMKHEKSHEQVAWEWFGYGQTLALLPLNGNQSSTVLTLPQNEMARLQELDETLFAREMERRIGHRLGEMELVSSRHVYPLVGVFADRLSSTRAALVGDAAVGMHPVTAHGFNFGLQSQRRLADTLIQAHQHDLDIGADAVLQRYARAQRLASWPLYQATNLLVDLYTNDRAPVKLLRNAGLRLAQGMRPLRWAIARHLTQPDHV